MKTRAVIEQLILEAESEITPSDIYNFYYLWQLHSYTPQLLRSDYGAFVADEFLGYVKKKYVAIFSRLLFKQLQKYQGRTRVDPDFDMTGVTVKDPGVLRDMMAKTFRSDMSRRNKRWDLIADSTANLASSSRKEDIFYNVNALNMAVHNTRTSILDKLSSPQELLKALQTVTDVDPTHWKGHVKKDIRSIETQDEF